MILRRAASRAWLQEKVLESPGLMMDDAVDAERADAV